MDKKTIALIVRTLIAAFRVTTELHQVHQMLLDALDEPEFDALTDEQKWQVQREVRNALRTGG